MVMATLYSRLLKDLENGQPDNDLSGLAKLLMEETMKEVSADFWMAPCWSLIQQKGLGVRTGQCPNGSFFCNVKNLNPE